MKKLLVLGALAVLAFITSSSANAQIVIPPGQQITCVLHCHGLIFIRLSDGTIIEMQANASGDATLESVEANDGSDGNPIFTRFTPVSINVQGNDPTLGGFEFEFEPTSTLSLSEVTPTDQSSSEHFPATCTVRANVVGRIDAFPGEFRNVTECEMQATNLTSFNPHNNESYVFTKDVEFRNSDDDDANAISFVIPAGATVVLN